jgi:DnaJ-class molecular chaperone
MPEIADTAYDTDPETYCPACLGSGNLGYYRRKLKKVYKRCTVCKGSGKRPQSVNSECEPVKG